MNTAVKGVVVLTRMLDAGKTQTEFLRVGTIEECQQWYEFQWQQVIAARPDFTVKSFTSGPGNIDDCQRCVAFNLNGEPEFVLFEYRERHFLYARYISMIEAEAALIQPTKLMLYSLPMPGETPDTPASVDGFLFGKDVDVQRLQAHELHEADGAPVEDKDARIRQLEALLIQAAQVIAPFADTCKNDENFDAVFDDAFIEVETPDGYASRPAY